MTLSDWIDVPENLEWYNANIKNSEKMQSFLTSVQEELAFETRPPEMISGEMALTLHGRNVGAQRAIKLIKNAGTTSQKVEGAVAGYQLENTLQEMGYTETDAKRLARDYMGDM